MKFGYSDKRRGLTKLLLPLSPWVQFVSCLSFIFVRLFFTFIFLLFTGQNQYKFQFSFSLFLFSLSQLQDKINVYTNSFFAPIIIFIFFISSFSIIFLFYSSLKLFVFIQFTKIVWFLLFFLFFCSIHFSFILYIPLQLGTW